MPAKLIKRNTPEHSHTQQQIHRFNVGPEEAKPAAPPVAKPKDPRVTQITAREEARKLLGLKGA